MENILGKRIRFLREEKELSQLQLAKILNISNSTLSQYEAGNRVPSDEIKKVIAKYFNVSLDYLMGASDIKSTEQNQLKDPTLEKIDALSEESKKELDKYLELLKIKDQVEKSKDETSSALENEA